MSPSVAVVPIEALRRFNSISTCDVDNARCCPELSLTAASRESFVSEPLHQC